MEKKGRTNRKYSAEFKIGVIFGYAAASLGDHWPDIAGHVVRNRTSSLHLRERIYVEEDVDGFIAVEPKRLTKIIYKPQPR